MKKFVYILFTLIFLFGLGIFLYPYFYDYTFDKRASEVIDDFIQNLPEQESDSKVQVPDGDQPEEPEKAAVYPELYSALEDYNRSLAEGAQISLNSNTAYKQFPVSLKDYGLKDEMIGYISLPSINMELPLYLGASNEHLKIGVAVMGYTSAPIGGISTNCVIAGHNNWNGAGRFRYIKELKTGDEAFVTTFWGQRRYVVTHAVIINDNDFASIYIQTGKDMITLMTCHKENGIIKRYLVFCESAE